MFECCSIVAYINAVNEVCIMKTQPLVKNNRSHYCETMDSELYRSKRDGLKMNQTK